MPRKKYINSGKKTGGKLMDMLLEAAAIDFDVEAERLLYECWPNKKWAGWIMEIKRATFPLMIIEKSKEV